MIAARGRGTAGSRPQHDACLSITLDIYAHEFDRARELTT
jgi:hypothetical protein